jgi:peptide/nickel transport system substrate-binding protein
MKKAFLKFNLVVGAGVAAVLAAGPAAAQKSQDSLRLAVNDPIFVLSSYHVPADEASNFSRGVYQMLISYDEMNKKYVPVLAKSYTRISATVLEFELRDDMTFHNGNKFDADDVVYTVNYLKDPKVSLTFKSRYTWIDTVEKLGPYKVRITAKEPNSVDLGFLAYRFNIWDAESWDKIEDKADYGRLNPVGTGQYKVTMLDKNKGVQVERWDGYKGNTDYFAAPIKKIHGIPMPDPQTRVAQLMTGGVEMIRNATPDQAKDLSSNPNLRVTNVPTAALFYVGLDAAGRSGVKPTQDPRVRRAMFMAIDRDKLIKFLVPGGPEGVAEKLQALCFKDTIGCKFSKNAPDYNPEAAKKLLAEAGYPNGFDIEYVVFAPNKPLGEAIAGDLLKIGVRAQISPDAISVYRRKQGDGKLQMWSILFPTGSHPEADNILGVYFDGPAGPYFNDATIAKWMKEGTAEFDLAKRENIYQNIFDRINEQAYYLPVTSVPTVYVHSKDVRIEPSKLYSGERSIYDYVWN